MHLFVTNKTKFIFLSLVLSLVSIDIFAADQYNNYCVPVKLNAKNKIIYLDGKAAAKSAKLFYIHNIAKTEVRLDHGMSNNPHASAGWGSHFQANNWSVILLDKANFSVNCAVQDKDGKDKTVNCASVISICEAKLPDGAKVEASYWVSEDKSWDDAYKDVLNRFGTLNK